MAVTPQSIVRSPMLMLALLISTGLTIFGVSLFFGSCPSKQKVKSPCSYEMKPTAPPAQVDAGVCTHIADELPADASAWSEDNWVRLVRCLDNAEESLDLIRVADRALNYYPHSEILYNVKAIHELELKRYDAAVTTLQTGLQMVTPSNHVMENNLAWAGLWESRRIDALTARELYESALDRRPDNCETLHTGLWVEYAIAMKHPGRIRHSAIENYSDLRADYDRCISRIDYGDEHTLFEVLGAGVLDHEMSKFTLLRQLETGRIAKDDRGPADAQLVERALMEHNERFQNVDINTLCAEASPVRSATHRCRGLLRSELSKRARTDRVRLDVRF